MNSASLFNLVLSLSLAANWKKFVNVLILENTGVDIIKLDEVNNSCRQVKMEDMIVDVAKIWHGTPFGSGAVVSS